MSEPTTNEAVLASVNATVAELITGLREGLHGNAPLREQIPRIQHIAEQYELVGMHDVAQKFHRQADALVPLREMEDHHLAETARREQVRRRRRRLLTFGIAR